MPPKRPSSESAANEEEADGRLSKEDGLKVQRAVMLWLAIPGNRNIVMGSAGNAQNQGGMAGKQVVVPKSQGFAMMAKYVTEMTELKISTDQAEGKFRYMLSKYSKANAYSHSSSAGVTDADRAKNIHTIPAKLEAMCPNYEVWASYFGHLQKFNPASVVSSASRGLEVDDANEDSAGCEDVGSDAEKESDYIAERLAEGADAQLGEQVQGDGEGADGSCELEGDCSLGDSSSFGVGSPRGGGVGTPSRTPSRGSVTRGRGGAVQQRQTISQQQAALLQQTKTQLNNVVACGASGTTPRGTSTFDVTYAAVKREQITSTTLMHKETLDGLVELIVRLLCLMYSQAPNILNKKSCCLRKRFSAAIKNSKRS
jgi:hypothetical protein